MAINIIVSVSENWVIGKDNKLLWKLSNDLKRFKELTLNKPIIMGENTYYSLPNGALPNRYNIILTLNKKFNEPNTIPSYSIEDSLEKAKKYGDDIFIIGGGNVYNQFFSIADNIYLTVVHTIIDGDTKFPKITKEWNCLSEEFHLKDDKNEYNYTYKLYKKNNKNIIIKKK